MSIAGHRLKLEKRSSLAGWKAATISILAIVFALMTVNRFIFVLLCTYAFIIPFRAGLWNIGMTGQLYAGALGAFAVLYAFGAKESSTLNLVPGIIIPTMMIAAALGGAALGSIAGFLKGKFDVNEIVVTMMLNFIMSWLVAFMIKEGGAFMNPGGRGESFELPPSAYAPIVLEVPFTVFLALGLGVLLYFTFAKTKIGYQIKAFGLNPVAARYAGISSLKIPLLVFCIGGAVAGLAGYHYFAAVPGVYKIARNYAFFGDLAFYGIICGLISLGNPLAAIPVALLFGGLSIGGRFVQGKLNMGFGLDYALLGVLMITLVAFQFFFRYQIVTSKTEETRADVGVHR
jgi:ABC-type uncharacterized transport system permease subunit